MVKLSYFKYVLGSSGVGKSSLLARYTEDKFITHTISTAGLDMGNKVLHKDDKKINVNIMDTAG